MALYAFDEDDLIFAADALPTRTYWCLDCYGPVKRRRGKKIAHFYHVRTARTCRLYSKSEDHMLAQVQLLKSFPEGALKMERPFIEINRIADLCWESEKIVFEIQCSPISEKEAEMRTSDYRSIGYEVIWLLDDKHYNRRTLRPAERFLRRHNTYYLHIKQGLSSEYYDQFEVFTEKFRSKKGGRMPLNLQAPRKVPAVEFPEEHFPKQICELNCLRYFKGSRLH
jgi:competence protein CoiA